MAAAHAYVTFVADDDTGYVADVATISPGALAASDLSDPLRFGDPAVFLAAVAQMSSPDGDRSLEVARLDFTPDLLNPDQLAGHLAAVLDASRLADAVGAWNQPLAPDDQRTRFAVTLLDATVLAEYSDATAMKAAGAVGAATATGSAGFAAALIASHAGVAVLIASPIGIVVAGPAAAYLTWRLLTHRRRRGTA
jgi:hypothetical protein